MAVNEKKSIRLRNRTNYFIPGKDKTHVSFSSPKSYQFNQQKVESYETRLYYEFKRSQELGGQTFFYTLTYNDSHVPNYMGQVCFDYEDLRYLFTGGFRKFLLRKYATCFRYFVGAELGEGKGSRGHHNNPHYHILFFLRPSEKPVYVPYVHQEIVGYYQRNSKLHSKGEPKYKLIHEKKLVRYMKITPEEFRSAIRKYWQGFDEDEGFKDYRTCRYGICREGSLDKGVVQDYRAIAYVAKYATKDVAFIKHEFALKQELSLRFDSDYRGSFKSYADFLHTRIYYLYNVPRNASRTEWLWNDKELCYRLVPDLCKKFTLFEDWLPSWIADCTKGIIALCGLEQDYEKFLKESCEQFVHEKIIEFRNRHSNKVRISQEVGSSALEGIDSMNPSLLVPSKDGYKKRNLGLYLYRKLFTEVYTDVRGHSTRVLNELGIKYKVSRLDNDLKKLSDKVKAHLDLVVNDSELYYKMYCSDVNTDVTCSFDDFRIRLSELLKDFSLDEIISRYSKYKLIYEERFIKVDSDRVSAFGVHSVPDYRSDFEHFLGSSVGFVRRSNFRLSLFLQGDMEGYLPYSLVPYFNRFLFVFRVLDLCTDYFFVSADDKAQFEAQERRKNRKFHTDLGLQSLFQSINF